MGNIEKFKNKKIAVLCGGVSGEREVSLRSGKKVYESLISQGLNAILLDTKEEDFLTVLKTEKVDLACIMLHGRFGEDGTIQGFLEILGIPYTGSKVLASALGMNKIASKKIWLSNGIPTPKFIEIDPKGDLNAQCERIKRVFPFPLVIKPTNEGSSLGVSILKDERTFEEVLKNTIYEFNDVFVEEFIDGIQTTVGVLQLENEYKALPILELRPKGEFYDYKSKYTNGMTEFIIPANLPKQVYASTQEIAVKSFRALGCRGFARIDIIVDRDGVPFVHDANTIPGMTELSDLPAQASADGITYDQLVLHILESAFYH